MTDEVTQLAHRMAQYTSYDDAWMLGLEIQAFGPTTSVQAFCFVLDNGSLEARQAAAFWLSDEAEMVPGDIFFKMAKDNDSDIRFHAAYCLGYVKDKRTVETLRKMMHQDDSEEVRQTAAQSLYAAAKLNGCLDRIVNDYQYLLTKDHSPKVREEAVTCLANFLKTPVTNEAISLLEKALEDMNETVRDQAKISLSVLRNEVWHDVTISNVL